LFAILLGRGGGDMGSQITPLVFRYTKTTKIMDALRFWLKNCLKQFFPTNCLIRYNYKMFCEAFMIFFK
jgi:hypothetical protein